MRGDIHYTSYLGSEWNQKPKTESRVYDSTSPAKGQRTFLREKNPIYFQNTYTCSCAQKGEHKLVQGQTINQS